MNRTLLIERVMDETRLAVIEEGQLMELYVQRPDAENLTGNIYLGRVERVLPGMNAAFVDLGLEKRGFLAAEDASTSASAREGLPIDKLLRPGQEVLCQVVKAGYGSKGPRLTCSVTLPGRRMALLGGVRSVGVSKKIGDADERERLHGIGTALMGEGGSGLILRTAAEGASEELLGEEYARLIERWHALRNTAEHASAPKLLHDDNALYLRAIRDKLGPRVDALWADGEALYRQMIDAASTLAGEWRNRIKLHTAETPLFDLWRVDAQADKALQKYVWLKSGGSLVIEETEALTVVDVNTGKNVGKHDAQDTIYKLNCEAAVELLRQLRLRDIGGIVVVDFIDMKSEAQKQALLDLLGELAKNDDTRVNIAGITQLGLVELTRKKERQSLSRQLLHICSDCGGNGKVPSHETTARRLVHDMWRRRRSGDASPLLIEADAKVYGWVKTIGAPPGGPTYARAKVGMAAGDYAISPVDEAALPPNTVKLI